MNPDIEKIREFFSHDRYAAMTGAYIEEASERYSLCSLEIGDEHRNAMGGVMGAVYFTLADFAFAVASNAYLEKPDIVNISSSISFMNYCKGSKLFAKAECIKDGRTTVVYNVTVTDDTGKTIVFVTCTGCHTGR